LFEKLRLRCCAIHESSFEAGNAGIAQRSNALDDVMAPLLQPFMLARELNVFEAVEGSSIGRG